MLAADAARLDQHELNLCCDSLTEGMGRWSRAWRLPLLAGPAADVDDFLTPRPPATPARRRADLIEEVLLGGLMYEMLDFMLARCVVERADPEAGRLLLGSGRTQVKILGKLAYGIPGQRYDWLGYDVPVTTCCSCGYFPACTEELVVLVRELGCEDRDVEFSEHGPDAEALEHVVVLQGPAGQLTRCRTRTVFLPWFSRGRGKRLSGGSGGVLGLGVSKAPDGRRWR